MVVKVIIENPNGTEVIREGLPLSSFCTGFKYIYKEGLENDECILSLVFDSVYNSNLFLLTRGRSLLIRYGFSDKLSSKRNVVIDRVEKSINQSGIGIEVTLIPLIEYKNKNFPISLGTAWENLKETISKGSTVEFSFPYNHPNHKIEMARARVMSDGSIPGEYTLVPIETDIPKVSDYTYHAGYMGIPYLLPKMPDPTDWDNVALNNALSVLDSILEYTKDMAGLVADCRDDYVTVKQKDLDQKAIAIIQYPGEVISYDIAEANKAIASESMVQAIVDEKTKELGLVEISALPAGYQELTVTHVGKRTKKDSYLKADDENYSPPHTVEHKVYSNGENFYVSSEISPDKVVKLNDQGKNILIAQLNSEFDRLGRTHVDLYMEDEIEMREKIRGFNPILPVVPKYEARNVLPPPYEQLIPLSSYLSDEVRLASSEQYTDPGDKIMKASANDVSAYLMKRATNAVMTSFRSFDKNQLVNKMVQLTTDESLNKYQLSVTVEGRTDLSVGKVLYFKSTLFGDSGRFYITEIEDEVSKQGFITKVTGLRVPRSMEGIRTYFTNKIAELEKLPEETMEELIHKVFEEATEEWEYRQEQNHDLDPCKVGSDDINEFPWVEFKVIPPYNEVIVPVENPNPEQYQIPKNE